MAKLQAQAKLARLLFLKQGLKHVYIKAHVFAYGISAPNN
jgi:hypothetical protein